MVRRSKTEERWLGTLRSSGGLYSSAIRRAALRGETWVEPTYCDQRWQRRWDESRAACAKLVSSAPDDSDVQRLRAEAAAIGAQLETDR